MDDNLITNLSKICKVLNKNFVQYLVVGGAAVALNGYFRKSVDSSGQISDKLDLDIWYNPNYNNYFKLLNALEELKLNVLEFKNEIAPNPKKSFFKFELENFTLDFLPELNGLSKFSLSYQEKASTILQGIEVFFLSYEDLIKNKQFNSRPKDLIDIEQLKKIKSQGK